MATINGETCKCQSGKEEAKTEPKSSLLPEEVPLKT